MISEPCAARVALDRLLSTDPLDDGCANAVEQLHTYVELVASGQDPEVSHPGITAHLRSCAPCQDDFDGLLAAVLRGS